MGSIRNALAVLEVVGDRQPVGVSDVARALGIPKTTAHRTLQELGALGWIRSSDGEQPRWSLTSKVLTLSGQLVAESGVRQLALTAMQELHQQTGETIHLTVPEDGYVVLLDKIDSTKAVRAWSWVGGRAPIHASSSGKAILAWLEEGEVRSMLGTALERFTDLTVTDVDSLLIELKRVRSRGYALNPGEWRTDVASCGAPLLDQTGRPVGALSISMPAHRFPEEKWESYGELVRSAALSASGRG